MAGSVQRLVRQGVIDALAALPDLDEVRVSFAYEFGQDVRERIFTTRSRALTPPASMKAGRNFRDEAAQFDIVILVEGVGLSTSETEERMDEISVVVEEWLADNKTGEVLDVTGLNWIHQDSWEVTDLGNDRGALVEKVITVSYNARLT